MQLCEAPGCDEIGRWPIRFVGAFPLEINGVSTPDDLEGMGAILCDEHAQPIFDAKATALDFDGSGGSDQ